MSRHAHGGRNVCHEPIANVYAYTHMNTQIHMVMGTPHLMIFKPIINAEINSRCPAMPTAAGPFAVVNIHARTHT